MKSYRVGGAVRDTLLNLPFCDTDWVVVGATPEQMREQGFRPVGKDFPVFLHPDTSEEYALARTERKSGRGYQGFAFYTSPEVTLEEDLIRRDLTINAMAMDDSGTIIDPYGGRADLENKCLRHVSPAFVEDPLRVLRVARFAARLDHLGFSIAPETLQLMRELSDSGELQHLAAERVWKETERALGEPSPHIYLRTLRDCGALAVLFPEIDRLYGVPQRADYHPEIDTGIHIEMSLQQAALLSSDTAVRFAVLVHDLGKGTTPDDILPRHIGHEARGVPLVKALCQRLRVPNNHRQLAEAVTAHHLLCHQAATLKPATLLKLLKNTGGLKSAEKLEQFLLACLADARGRTGFEQSDYPSVDYLREARQRAASATIADLLDENISGAEIGRQLEKRQLAALTEFRKSYGQ